MTFLKTLLIVLVVGLLIAFSVLMLERALAQTVGVTLQWTAPGDDGTVGRASSYDLRFSTAAISGTDTLSWWNAAAQATGEPVPGVAGSTDSTRVLGLSPSTTYRFIVRATDDGLPQPDGIPRPNTSGFSNVAVILTPDQTPPARVTDLRVAP